MWLFHLCRAVKIQTFSPAFPSAESIAKAFCWLSIWNLWNFKEKASAISHSQPFVVITPRIGLPNQRIKPPERIPFRRLRCFFVRKVFSLLAGVALAAHLSTSRTPWERRGRSGDTERASPSKRPLSLSQQAHCSSSNAFNVK